MAISDYFETGGFDAKKFRERDITLCEQFEAIFGKACKDIEYLEWRKKKPIRLNIMLGRDELEELTRLIMNYRYHLEMQNKEESEVRNGKND